VALAVVALPQALPEAPAGVSPLHGQGQVRLQSNSVGIDDRARRERSIISSGGYGELGTMDLVEPESAVVDDRGLP
jgi:hypothetical protein